MSWSLLALILILTAACDATAAPLNPAAMAAAGTAAAATATALPAGYLALTSTAARGTADAAAVQAATLGALAERGTSQAVSDVGTRAAADAAARMVAATATAAALGAQAAGTAAAVIYATDRARTAAQVDAWRAWAWAWIGAGALIGLALAVIWRLGLLIEAAGAALLAWAKARNAEAEHTRARTALISGAVTLLENPEFTLRDNWRSQVLKFAALAEPMRFNERVMAEAGVSYEKSRLFSGILQAGGALDRTRSGSRWAVDWGAAELAESVGLGKFDNLFPRGQDGALIAPPALA